MFGCYVLVFELRWYKKTKKKTHVQLNLAAENPHNQLLINTETQKRV